MASKFALVGGVGLFLGVSAGCGAGSGDSAFEPGDAGSDGSSVSQEAAAPFSGSEAGPASCGDGTCDDGESCTTCSIDCGQCLACAYAPSCSDAVGIPASPTTRLDLDQGVSGIDAGPEGGAPPPEVPGQDGCGDAQLRMRIASITALKGGGQIYCIVSASDGVTAEVALTAKTGSLSDGQTSSFDPASAIFWGQGTSLHTTTDNLTTTYDCFKVVDNSGWSSALGALSSAANTAGATVGGPYGWAFGAASSAAAAAGAAVAATNGDDHLFNAQQTIGKSDLLSLTNGSVWSIEASGGSAWTLNAWDWRIEVEAWGCATGTTSPR